MDQGVTTAKFGSGASSRPISLPSDKGPVRVLEVRPVLESARIFGPFGWLSVHSSLGAQAAAGIIQPG
jgi:hypothetical protein